MTADKGEEKPQIVFIDRVRKLPLVSAAYEYTSNKYCTVRDYNPVVKSVIEKAEKSVHFAAEQSTPVFQTFKFPLGIADSVACKTLDFVENTVPIVKKTPDQIASDTKNAYANVLESRVDFFKGKIVTAKSYGQEKATTFMSTPYGQVLKDKVEHILDSTGYLVDKYVPVPKGIEYHPQPISGVKPGETQEKAMMLGAKFQRLLVIHTQAQLQNLSSALQALANLKDMALAQIYSAHTKVHLMYADVVKRSKEEGTLENRVVSTAYHVIFLVQNTLGGITEMMPVPIQNLVQSTLTNLNDLINILKTTEVKDLPAVLLTKVQQQIKDIYNYLDKARGEFFEKVAQNGSKPKST